MNLFTGEQLRCLIYLEAAIRANLPIVFGEIANKQDDVIDEETQYCYYDLDGASENKQPQNAFTYQMFLQLLKEQEIGWLAWCWWKDGCSPRQMTQDGNFSGLTSYGDDLVNNPDYGLKAMAQRSTAFGSLPPTDTPVGSRVAPDGA